MENIHGGIKFQLDELDWGCEYYLKHHKMMPEDGLKRLSDGECILLGAVGAPDVPVIFRYVSSFFRSVRNSINTLI